MTRSAQKCKTNLYFKQKCKTLNCFLNGLLLLFHLWGRSTFSRFPPKNRFITLTTG